MRINSAVQAAIDLTAGAAGNASLRKTSERQF